VQLNVPYVKQPAGSVLCGPACATMVLRFFGRKKSFNKVTEEIQVKSKAGITVGHLASYFLSQGMDTTIQAWPLGMSEKYYTEEPIRGEIAVETLKRGAKGDAKGKARGFCRETVTAAKRGVSLILRPIILSDLRRQLVKAPVIVSLDQKYFVELSRKTGHYAAAYGITPPDSQVTQPYLYVHDPDLAAEAFLPVKDILNACNSWFGSVIYATPKAER